MTGRIKKLLLFVGLCLLGIVCGIGGYVLSGVITLLSLVAMVENISFLKAVVYHCNKLIDIALFAVGAYCKFKLGVTIGMAVMIAGLGYSLVYGPYVREMYRLTNDKSK